MNADRIHRAVSALSTPQAMALIMAIKDSHWYIPSRAAAKAKVHTSTATKHLTALHGAGVLERRRVRTETGHAYAYRLSRPSITLTLDLFPESGALPKDQVRAAFALLADVVRKAEALGGPGLRDRVAGALKGTFPRQLEGLSEATLDVCFDRLRTGPIPSEMLAAGLRAVRATIDSCIGPLACDRLFRLCFEEAGGVQSMSRLPTSLLLGREVGS